MNLEMAVLLRSVIFVIIFYSLTELLLSFYDISNVYLVISLSNRQLISN